MPFAMRQANAFAGEGNGIMSTRNHCSVLMLDAAWRGIDNTPPIFQEGV